MEVREGWSRQENGRTTPIAPSFPLATEHHAIPVSLLVLWEDQLVPVEPLAVWVAWNQVEKMIHRATGKTDGHNFHPGV
jgi:hypothetical protein